jgi:hypothetical protein
MGAIYNLPPAIAQSIRAHLILKYIKPARRQGETLVTITAGDITKNSVSATAYPASARSWNPAS